MRLTLATALALSLALVVAGCSGSDSDTSASSESSEAAQASTTARADFAGQVDIGGGRKMYLECRGTGSPTVVLESGLRYSADEWSSMPNAGESAPMTVFPEVANFARVCAYDRPGTIVGGESPSRSDPVSQPVSARDAVADLHALLSAADEPGPYVLAGHSYGGLIVRLYASTYPDDVSGLVLIDALAEDLQTNMTPEQWALWKLLNDPTQEDLAEYKDMERHDVDRSFEEVRAAAPLRPLPLVVLSADRPWGPQLPSLIASGKIPSDAPPDFGYVIDAAQKVAQEHLANLVPNAEHITDTNSGRDIQYEQPQLVIDAIRQVVEAARNDSSM